MCNISESRTSLAGGFHSESNDDSGKMSSFRMDTRYGLTQEHYSQAAVIILFRPAQILSGMYHTWR
jgi:hypothetical protein